MRGAHFSNLTRDYLMANRSVSPVGELDAELEKDSNIYQNNEMAQTLLEFRSTPVKQLNQRRAGEASRSGYGDNVRLH